MQVVYFDGSFEACGHLMRACSMVNARVMVVLARNISPEHYDFVMRCEDCCGSLGHFENGRFVRHVRVGSKRQCSQVTDADGVELFLRQLADRDDLNDEEKIDLLKTMSVCDRDGCASCSTCERTRRLAEEYGFYDFVEWAPTFSQV